MSLLNVATNFVGGSIGLLLLFMILPLFIQLGLKIFIAMLGSLLRSENVIRAILDIILLPGSLLRLLLIFGALKIFGYEFKMNYVFPYFGRPASNIGNNYNYRGPTPSTFSRKNNDPLKLSFAILVATYLAVVFVFLWMWLANPIIFFLHFLIPDSSVMPVFWFTTVSLALGSIPDPAESTASIYVVIMSRTFLVMGIILMVLSGALMTYATSFSVGSTYTMAGIAGLILLNRYRELVGQEQLEWDEAQELQRELTEGI